MKNINCFNKIQWNFNKIHYYFCKKSMFFQTNTLKNIEFQSWPWGFFSDGQARRGELFPTDKLSVGDYSRREGFHGELFPTRPWPWGIIPDKALAVWIFSRQGFGRGEFFPTGYVCVGNYSRRASWPWGSFPDGSLTISWFFFYKMHEKMLKIMTILTQIMIVF